jgi:hypothetical protein
MSTLAADWRCVPPATVLPDAGPAVPIDGKDVYPSGQDFQCGPRDPAV